MNSAAEYQSIPTTKTQIKGHRREGLVKGLFFLIFFASFGAPFIIFGVLRYKYVNEFSTQPSSCRVNAIGAELKTRWKSRNSFYPIWNVDIVKQSTVNSAAKDLVVLRSDLNIWGSNNYRTVLSVLGDAEQLYSVGKIYPCYVRKQLLDDPANDNKEKKLKHAVQWEKPSKISSIIMLSIGSAVILMVIIVTIRIIITSND